MLNLNFIKKQDIETKKLLKNISWSILLKGISVIINFLSVPFLLSYLNQTDYGLWLTMSSFFSWFIVFDLGTGNGLRNKLAEAITKNDTELAKIYVSTSYLVLCLIFCTIYFVFYFLRYYIDWVNLFNANEGLDSQLFLAATLLFASLCCQFVLKLISTILIAHQYTAWADALNILIQALIISFIYFIGNSGYEAKLLNVVWSYSFLPVVILLTISIILFRTRFKYIAPSFSNIHFPYFSKISNIGYKFFLIQIAGIILYASDNYLISQLLNPEAVTTYSIVYKYFSIIPIIWALFLVPFWTATTKAIAKNEYDWIQSTVKKLIYIWVLLSISALFILLVSEKAYKIWVGPHIEIPFILSLVMFIYTIIAAWGALFGNFLNGAGKLKIQLYTALFGAAINIPLSIFFCKSLNWGIISIPLATLISLLIGAIFSTVQYYKIINFTAKGIWNE